MKPSDLAHHYVVRFIHNETSAKNYIAIARIFEKSCNTHDISEVTAESVILWRRDVLSRLSVHSYNTYLRHLRILFLHAQKSGFIQNNPFESTRFVKRCLKSKAVSLGVIKSALALLDKGEVLDLETDRFWALVIRFLLCTGIRRRQLVSLRWSHINFEQKTILLCQDGSKNGREWTIPMTDASHEILQSLLERTLKRKKICDHDQVFRLPLFNSRVHTPTMEDHQVTDFFILLHKKTGLRISSHRLRHTLGTKLGTSETPDIAAIQELFGHSSLNSTRIYVNSNVGHIRNVLHRDGFEEALTSPNRTTGFPKET